LLIDLSWNSSRLEGNTYSRLDTERLLAGEPVDGKAVHERQMILNHKQAIEWLVTESSSYQITPYVLRSLHAMLAENLLPNHDAGRERTTSVSILGSTFHPLEVPQQIEECLRQIAHTTALIADPFEESFFLLVHVPYLQPFIDVNKRTARLAANIPPDPQEPPPPHLRGGPARSSHLCPPRCV
jgi:Fic family protein